MQLARVLLVQLALAAAACASEEPSAPRPTAEAIAGQYGQGVAGIVSLDLTADGRYESLILNGVTIDGCGTFEGAGVSKGTWAFVGEEIRFTPDHPAEDLIVRFTEVRATPAEDGLHVVVGERAATLPRLQPYD